MYGVGVGGRGKVKDMGRDIERFQNNPQEELDLAVHEMVTACVIIPEPIG